MRMIQTAQQDGASAPTHHPHGLVVSVYAWSFSHQDGASAPTNPTRTVAGWNRINVGCQDGASAPVPTRVAQKGMMGGGSRTAQAPPPIISTAPVPTRNLYTRYYSCPVPLGDDGRRIIHVVVPCA